MCRVGSATQVFQVEGFMLGFNAKQGIWKDLLSNAQDGDASPEGGGGV